MIRGFSVNKAGRGTPTQIRLHLWSYVTLTVTYRPWDERNRGLHISINQGRVSG